MTVLERPAEVQRTSRVQDPEAIFPEARRRGRRRRAFSALAAISAAGALVAGVVVGLNSAATPSATTFPPVSGSRSGSDRAPAVLVAWGDYAGALHVGDLANRRQLQIATHPAVDVSTGVALDDGGRLLWVDGKDRVRSVELATGRVSVVAPGTGVAIGADGARLYVDQGTRDFLELDARSLRVTRRVAIPAGWRANPWIASPVSGGLVLMRSGKATVFGIWHPGSKVRPLGAAEPPVLDSYTPPRGGYSLVAWVPRCASHRPPFGSGCPLAITNTGTGRTVTVRSPTRYGFTGGAFSPGGSELATFVNTDNPSDPLSTPRSELALVNTTTGALRRDPKAKMITTEDAAWALWLPPGRQLLAGAISATYLVNAHSLATRPFYFDGGDTRAFSVMGSPDLNFSALVVSPGALSPNQRRLLGLAKAPRKVR